MSRLTWVVRWVGAAVMAGGAFVAAKALGRSPAAPLTRSERKAARKAAVAKARA